MFSNRPPGVWEMVAPLFRKMVASLQRMSVPELAGRVIQLCQPLSPNTPIYDRDGKRVIYLGQRPGDATVTFELMIGQDQRTKTQIIISANGEVDFDVGSRLSRPGQDRIPEILIILIEYLEANLRSQTVVSATMVRNGGKRRGGRRGILRGDPSAK